MNVTDLNKKLNNNTMGDVFKTLYHLDMDKQTDRYLRIASEFERHFGDAQISIFSAPGRSEIGGNHTDHQHGRVLAAAIDLDAVAIAEQRDDNIVEIISGGYELEAVDLSHLDIVASEKETSESLIRGIAARFEQLGYKFGGFRAYMESDVLGGSGLSSSACFEVLVGTIFNHLYNEATISAVEIAQIGQYAENNYFMKPSGLMDQMACSVGGFVGIDFKDVTPVIEKVDFGFEDVDHVLCIVDTKGSHADLTDDYAAMPQEMKLVASHFGKEVLRDVCEDEFYSAVATLRGEYGDRPILRAMHFFEENARVVDQIAALKENRFDEFKKLVEASGHSSFEYLQNVYSPKDISEQNLSIALGISKHVLAGRGAYRVHGGGLAGTIQAIVPLPILDDYKAQLERIFGEGSCYVLNIRPLGGVKIV